jgi:ankyrin repeat protein
MLNGDTLLHLSRFLPPQDLEQFSQASRESKKAVQELEYESRSFFEAAEAGEVKKVKTALQNGLVEFNAQNKAGETALMCAARGGSAKMATFLIEEARGEIDQRNLGNGTALTYAAEAGKWSIVKLLLEKDAAPCGPALGFAEWNGNTEMVARLKNARARYTRRIDEFFDEVQDGNNENVQALLDGGLVNINVQNEYGLTALMVSGDVDMTRCLLGRTGVMVDERTFQNGNTALMSAAFFGYEEIVQLVGSRCKYPRKKQTRKYSL